MNAFFLDSDDDGHWYIVQLAHKADWSAWCALSRDDENSWIVPDYAQAIDSPNSIIFPTFEIQ